jgi:hypothetical protein
MRFNFGRTAIYLASFVQESIDYRCQGAQELDAIQGRDQGLPGACLNLGRELVKASSIVGREIEPETSKAERVIARGAYPVFRLPRATTFDTETGTRCMMRGVPKQLRSRRRRDRRAVGTAPKEHSEFGSVRTEPGRRSDREIDLKTSLQQENPIRALTVRQIEEMHGAELSDQRCCQPVKNVEGLILREDTEGQIEIRPSVAFAGRQGTYDRSGNDPLIGMSDFQNTFMDAVTLLDREHSFSVRVHAYTLPPVPGKCSSDLGLAFFGGSGLPFSPTEVLCPHVWGLKESA